MNWQIFQLQEKFYFLKQNPLMLFVFLLEVTEMRKTSKKRVRIREVIMTKGIAQKRSPCRESLPAIIASSDLEPCIIRRYSLKRGVTVYPELTC
jgi:hypothetical protein